MRMGRVASFSDPRECQNLGWGPYLFLFYLLDLLVLIASGKWENWPNTGCLGTSPDPIRVIYASIPTGGKVANWSKH
jgi:hypothetical protein